METLRRVRLEIFGRVQGVFYRASTREKAQGLGLSGWVQNRPDGSVEAVVEGPRDDVQTLIEWTHEGPPHASVDAVDVASDEEVAGREFNAFQIRR